MPAPTPCPQCGTGLNLPVPAPDRVRCPTCQTVFTPHGMRVAASDPTLYQFPARPTSHIAVLPPVAPRRGGVGLWVIAVVVASLLLGGVGVGVNRALRKGRAEASKAETKNEKDEKKDEEKPRKDEEKPRVEEARILIDEDFKAAYEEKLSIPKGWTDGDAFRVVKQNDLHALEVSNLTGTHFVQLIPVVLGGDFAIECFYHLDHPAFAQTHTVILRLQNRRELALLPVAVDWEGKVLIGDDSRPPPGGYKPLQPTRMVVKREGKKISILLDGDLVVSKTFDTVPAFDTIKLGLAGGPGNAGRLARVFGIRVTSLAP